MCATPGSMCLQDWTQLMKNDYNYSTTIYQLPFRKSKYFCLKQINLTLLKTSHLFSSQVVPTLSAWMIRLWKTIKYYKSWLQVSLLSTIQRVYTLGNISACQVSVASFCYLHLQTLKVFQLQHSLHAHSQVSLSTLALQLKWGNTTYVYNRQF